LQSSNETLDKMLKRLSPRTVKGRRQGGLPRFTSEDVASIKADTRPVSHIAAAWRACYDTIARVREEGRFAGIPYVTRDEVLSGKMELMKDAPLPKNNRPGRKKVKPELDLDIETKYEIAYDMRAANVVAKKHRLTPEDVYAIRHELGIDQIKRRVYRATMLAIAASTSDTPKIAKAYKLSEETVDRIRNSYLAR
jgi:hypothetical protein